jgi:hypothetical protein
MGMGPVWLYTPRGRDQQPYEQWRDTPIGNGGTYDQYQQWLSSLQPGATPGLGQTPGPLPTPVAPPTAIPAPMNGPPGYAPPQVQMPQMLANPQPQGLGGMPLIRDRMMAATMSPFAQPNWGIQQVNPAYLTQQMRLPGGATPADAMASQMPAMGIGGPGASQLPVGLGGLRIPRRPVMGMGTA